MRHFSITNTVYSCLFVNCLWPDEWNKQSSGRAVQLHIVSDPLVYLLDGLLSAIDEKEIDDKNTDDVFVNISCSFFID